MQERSAILGNVIRRRACRCACGKSLVCAPIMIFLKAPRGLGLRWSD